MVIETGTTISDASDVDLATLDPSDGRIFQANKHHAYFKRLRTEAPVHWSPTGPSGPFWSLSKFDDIVAVDSNFELFSSDTNIVVGDQDPAFTIKTFIQADPPVHDVQRQAVTAAVAPKRIAELEELIRQRTSSVLDSLPLGEEFDWVDKVSIELTTQLLATLFDFPWDDRRLLPYWSDIASSNETTGNLEVDAAHRQSVMTECLEYMARLFQERATQEPKMDFLSLLAHNPQTRNMLDDPMEFLGNVTLLIIGGNDTTRHSMSGGVLFMDQNPAEFKKLKQNRSLIPNAVSEIIRYQTPVAHMRRTATQDTEIRGQKIRKGDRVVMWYVSGNRDDEVIERADEFIVDRDRARHHVSFGFGIHRCMGNRVAELQLRILWEEILKRFSRIEVVRPPKRSLSNFILGYSDMPVRLHV